MSQARKQIHKLAIHFRQSNSQQFSNTLHGKMAQLVLLVFVQQPKYQMHSTICAFHFRFSAELFKTP